MLNGIVWKEEKGKESEIFVRIGLSQTRWGQTLDWMLPCTERKAMLNTTKKDSEWFVKDKQETNPINIKPETASHVAEHFSWVPLPCCSLPRCPFPIKSLALSASVSSDNSFLSVRHEPSLGAMERAPLPTTSLLIKKHLDLVVFFLPNYETYASL